MSAEHSRVGMLDAFRHRSLRKAAEEALDKITPLVPTWNKPASPDRYIIPPKGLEGFWKLAWGPGIRLEHQTASGEIPYRHTLVERSGEKLKIEESCNDRSLGTSAYTEVVFVRTTLVSAYTWVNRENIKKPDRHTRKRIKETLSPKLPPARP